MSLRPAVCELADVHPAGIVSSDQPHSIRFRGCAPRRSHCSSEETRRKNMRTLSISRSLARRVSRGNQDAFESKGWQSRKHSSDVLNQSQEPLSSGSGFLFFTGIWIGPQPSGAASSALHPGRRQAYWPPSFWQPRAFSRPMPPITSGFCRVSFDTYSCRAGRCCSSSSERHCHGIPSRRMSTRWPREIVDLSI